MTHKWYRFRQDRILGGVASGLAAYLGVHPAIVRLFVVLVTLGFFGIPQLGVIVVVGYFIAWAVIPEVPSDLERDVKPLLPGLIRPKAGRRIEGVCAGIARTYKLDVNLVRVAMIALVLCGGLGLVTYVAGWILMPNESTRQDLSDAEHIARDRKDES
jgi:phage shock protein PspC (stress-responsive transcriptional regulator)